MARLMVTVIHQWWVKGAELEALLFSAPVEEIETRMHPAHTDTTETRYAVPAAALGAKVRDRLTSAGVELPVPPSSVVGFAGRKIDARIVAVTLASG